MLINKKIITIILPFCILAMTFIALENYVQKQFPELQIQQKKYSYFHKHLLEIENLFIGNCESLYAFNPDSYPGIGYNISYYYTPLKTNLLLLEKILQKPNKIKKVILGISIITSGFNIDNYPAAESVLYFYKQHALYPSTLFDRLKSLPLSSTFIANHNYILESFITGKRHNIAFINSIKNIKYRYYNNYLLQNGYLASFINDKKNIENENDTLFIKKFYLPRMTEYQAAQEVIKDIYNKLKQHNIKLFIVDLPIIPKHLAYIKQHAPNIWTQYQKLLDNIHNDINIISTPHNIPQEYFDDIEQLNIKGEKIIAKIINKEIFNVFP